MAKKPRPISYTLSEARERVANAVLLSGAATFLSLPMFYHQFMTLTGGVFERAPAIEEAKMMAAGQAILVFAMTFLCGLVGFLYADRIGMVGFGRLRDIRRWAPIGLAAGLAATPVMYFGLDRGVMAMAPEMYPDGWYWSVSWVLGRAVSQEVIGRFGLVTIGVYLLGKLGVGDKNWTAAAAVALFAAFSSGLFFSRLGLIEIMGPGLGVLALASVFALQCLYGWLYLRFGLVPAICVHAGMGLRLVLYSLFV